MELGRACYLCQQGVKVFTTSLEIRIGLANRFVTVRFAQDNN